MQFAYHIASIVCKAQFLRNINFCSAVIPVINHFIYVLATCNGNNRVQKLDTSGSYLLQLGSKGSEAGQLSSPHGITIYQDKAYTADCSNKHISVFHMSGRGLFYKMW